MRLGQAPALMFEKSFLKAGIVRGGSAKFLDDQAGSIVVVFSAEHTGEGYGFEVGGSGAMLATFINPAASSSHKLRDIIYDHTNDLFTKNERDLFYRLENRERFVKQHLKRLKPVAMSLRHSFGPPYEPGVPVTTVKLRGEYDNHGPVVKAGFPSIVTGHNKPAAIRLDPNNHVYFSNRSAAYLSAGLAEKALQDAQDCITAKPNWAKGYNRKGTALHALGLLREAFPGRTVTGLDSIDLIWGLGSFHCLTQQEPTAK